MSEPLAITAATPRSRSNAERRRLELLDETDRMLDHVELLRLGDQGAVPPLLVLRMRRVLAALGRPAPARLGEINIFHNLVFAIQQRLMAGNPRRAATRTHPGRAQGMPVLVVVGGAGRWKHLVLPGSENPEAASSFEAWLGLVDATVERALDRWNYAITQAVRCARDSTRRPQAGAAVALARVAWENYWDLAEEASALRRCAPGPFADAA